MCRLKDALAVVPLLLLLSGCVSVHQLAERSELSRHPIHERRMTNQPAAGYVATGVWRIKGARNMVYLAGTSHIVSKQEVPFPSSFYAAYNDSKVVHVEFDSLSWSANWMVVRAVPDLLRWTFAHGPELMYSNGRTLSDDLSPETIRKLREAYGDEFTRRQHLTPLGLLFWSDLMGAQGESGTGVDDVFTALAHRNFKPIRSLDDRSAVLLVTATMDALLADAKREIAERGADAVISEKLIHAGDENAHWRYGDMAASEKVHAEVSRISPELYQNLLPERNRKWMPRLERALKDSRNTFVLVGTAHLGGREGLLQLLRDAGYQPEQMYGVDRPGGL